MAEQTSTHATNATPPASASPGGHEWHSPPYVRRWVSNKEAQAEERRVGFDLMADAIPYPSDAKIHILDIGAGWGPVTNHLLTRFPSATATLLDYSEAMFAEARQRLASYGGRVTYVVVDLTRPGALAAAVQSTGGQVDVVVASCCIHNIDPAERVWALYREIRDVVAPGGCFLNLDSVGTDASILRDVSHRMRVEHTRRRRLAETGTLPSFAEVDAEFDAHRQGHYEGSHVKPERRSLADHLVGLQNAGFDEVECFWRQEGSALIGGYVAAG